MKNNIVKKKQPSNKTRNLSQKQNHCYRTGQEFEYSYNSISQISWKKLARLVQIP